MKCVPIFCLIIISLMQLTNAYTVNTMSNSLSSESLLFDRSEDFTRYFSIYRYANITNASISLTGSPADAWQRDYQIVNGATFTDYSGLEVFYMGSTWYLIVGIWDAGGFVGYSWNGTSWIANSTIVNGLPAPTASGEPYDWMRADVFTEGGDWWCVTGSTTEGKLGHRWNGGGWTIDNSIINGQGTTSKNGVETHWISGTLYALLVGNYPTAYPQIWDGSSWTSYAAGSSGVLVSAWSVPSMFYWDSQYHLVGATAYSYDWDGSWWTSNSKWLEGITSSAGTRPQSEVFVKDSVLYMITTNTIGYNWTSKSPNNPSFIFNNTELWSYAGEFSTSDTTDDFGSNISSALNSGNCDCTGCIIEQNNCLIPVKLHSDTIGNITYSEIDINFPWSSVNQSSPIDNAKLSNLSNTFVCNSSADIGTELKNVTINVYNSSGSLESYNSTDISGTINSTSFLITVSDEGTYGWECILYDTSNTYISVAANYTFIADITYPSISLLDTADNFSYFNKDNIFINVSASDANFKNITYNLYNETGLQTSVSYESLTTTHDFTSIDIGNYFYNVTICDQAANCNSTATIPVTLLAPTLTLNSPISEEYTSLQIPVIFVASNVSNCYYNLTVGGSLSSNDIPIVDCQNFSLVLAGEGNYEYDMWIIDYLGNTISKSVSFSTQLESGTGGGGGGGSTVTIVVGDNESRWSLTTETGGEKYVFLMERGDSRTKPLVFQNLGETERIINLECQSSFIDFCDYVTFSEDEFVLPVVKETETSIDFTLAIPEDLEIGNYDFNIIAIDDNNQSVQLTINANVETGGPITQLGTKLFSSANIFGISINYALLGLLIWPIFGVLIFFGVLKRTKLKSTPVWSLFLGLLFAIIVISVL